MEATQANDDDLDFRILIDTLAILGRSEFARYYLYGTATQYVNLETASLDMGCHVWFAYRGKH